MRDDETWYLMHLPMQAGFALAVPAAAAIAVLALANGVAGWWFAIVPPAGCAMWFGTVSAKYPDLVGSILGELSGLLAAGWGIAVDVAPWVTGFRAARVGVDGESSWAGAPTGSELTEVDPPGSISAGGQHSR